MAEPVTGEAITTTGLGRVFGDRHAVRDLDLRVPTGQVMGLLGPNGAGKTTTIRMLTTLLAPTSGSARVAGLDVRRYPARARRHIGYVPQEKGVRHLLTGRESAEIEADLHHIPRRERDRRVTEVLDLLGLLPDADRLVSEYSGGLQRRLDLACGLLHRPDVLILDEPTLGLDVPSRRQVWDHVRQLRDGGGTVLLATNYLDEADALCDRVTILDRGREVVTGTPAELKRKVGADVVVVRTRQPDRLGRALAGLPWVRQVKVVDADVSVFVADAPSALPAVMAEARRHDVAVLRATYERPTLDDVFVHFTGHVAAGAQ
ncbi:ATP-binding cassette domain-containing protein [Saccharothrix carnea]|uniref:ATP-binding cassette domain-containing protein n=1 Tax=Saccharothrix carnea TaxID=1280637 RepID=UPI0015E6ECB2|nr:ATP-binding cassette domain-containing protein [Saccharothrix carnea]